jgi:transcriptional regulator with XRE-family HTH domain
VFIVVRNRIRAAREGRGMSQREVALMCGIEPANLSRVEHVEVAPRRQTLERIAVALGLEPSDLVP